MLASPRASICVSRFMKALKGFHPILNRPAHQSGRSELWLYEFGGEPRESPQQIVRNENLPVTIGTGADADGRNRNAPGDFTGNKRGDQFQHDGKGARVSQSFGIGKQASPLALRLALDMVAAFFPHALRQHSEV